MFDRTTTIIGSVLMIWAVISTIQDGFPMVAAWYKKRRANSINVGTSEGNS